jgi:lipopolysaccharide/colanic/teichoic acid biosynthesis glycosyltransferase
MIKRTLDFSLAVLGLAVLLPLLLLIAVAVLLDDGWPVFFRQTRVGRYGEPFVIWKFRSMRVANQNGPQITSQGDARVTRVGSWLRRSKLDELPQLWNILRGDMSFVGPRPEVPRYVALYTAAQRAVLNLRPGLTDEASIRFRDEEALLAAAPDAEKFYVDHCLPRKVDLNLAYAAHASLRTDLGVIWRTIQAVWLRPKS